MVDIEPISFLLYGKKDLVVVEIGVLRGQSTEFMLENFSIQQYYGIDPFTLYKGYYEGSVENLFNENGEDGCYNAYLERVGHYPQLICMRKYSHEASKYFLPESIDLVFIDGNHAYEYVKQDIEDWWPLVKQGGILAGDDIVVEGVEKALNEYFQDKKYEVWRGKRSWFVIKKEVYW